MARRGFLASLQHAARVAARENERAQRAAVRNHNASVRHAEQTSRAFERKRAQLIRAVHADRKRLEKEEREAHIAAREAEAEEKNLELLEIYDDIDSLLRSTLDTDDYIDLEALRVVVTHPPFHRPDLESPVPSPEPIPDPPPPSLALTDPPKGLARLFGQRKHAEAVAKAEEAHDQALANWRTKVEETAARRQAAIEKHARAQTDRAAALVAARALYSEECAARDADAVERNRLLDELITNLGYGTTEAVHEYISIVLSNSVYPEHFPVTHDFEFESASAELRLRVLVSDSSSTLSKVKYRV